MKLQEDLQKEEKILERTKQEQEKFVGKMQAELDQERGIQNRPGVIERIEGRMTAIQKAYSDLIGKSEQRISSLKAEISQAETQKQEQARAELQGTKEKMRAAWLSSGGSAGSFEEQWPEMESRIIQEKVLQSENRPQYPMPKF